MIVKIVVGSGARGLLNYISRLDKAATQQQISRRELKNVHIANPDWSQIRGMQRSASLDLLPNLSSINLAHGTDARPEAGRQGTDQVLLHSDARFDVGGAKAADAAELRRPGNRAGAIAAKPGGRVLKQHRHAPPTFSNFAGSTPRQISAEFAALRKIKPGLKKAVGHLILSPGPGDRMLSKEEWQKAIDIVLEAHGASETAFAGYLHSDTAFHHCHLFFREYTPPDT